MNDDELKQLWQQQPLAQPSTLSAGQLTTAMQAKTTLFRRTIQARDFREVLICGLLVIVFGSYIYFERSPMVRLGWWIVIASLVLISWKLVSTRRSHPPAPPDATILESLRAELDSVRAQSHLLGSIFWWYLLPPGIGLLVATWAMPTSVFAKIPTTLFYIAVFAFIYWINQWARSKQLLPMEAQLEALIHSAETGQPLDETHIADLHPIALSTMTAQQAKPVEFNISYWQFVIHAELGFVGIWFFANLSKVLDQPSPFASFPLIFTWTQLLWSVPFILAGLLVSWILQKSTNRAVGISALGVHLCKGLVLIPWEEIKEVRPLRVLNIRSLWLIKASGEKSVMPWTSLANHAELKQAVETHAPINHPIRLQLPLLTRL